MPKVAPLVPLVPFPAEAPQLPELTDGDEGGPQYVVRASVDSVTPYGAVLNASTQSGGSLRVEIDLVASGIVRVLLAGDGDAPQRVTLAKSGLQRPGSASVREAEGGVVLSSDSMSVRVELDPFRISFLHADGRRALTQNYEEFDVAGRRVTLPFGFSTVDGQRVAFHDTFTAEPDEHFYGFGEKFTSFDKRGQRLRMWNYDAHGVNSERAYKNVPFFVSTKGYGIFVDSTTCIEFDIACSANATFSLVVPDDVLEYYVVLGSDPKSIVTRYAELVALPILPPKWAFGLWMSSGFKADSEKDVVDRARRLREENIPCDVLHLDCYWQRHGSWSDLIWDEESFPNPETMLKELKALGFKVCLWMNPYIGIHSPRFRGAEQSGYFLKDSRGEVHVVPLWGQYHPPVAIIDVTNPAAAEWVRELLRPLLRMGADVFKTDFGEGVPADSVAHNGMSGTKLHNLYPLLYNDLVAEVTAEETGGPGLVWGRSTYAGGQRHAAQWGGDPNCTYPGMASTLRGGLSMAMCGHAFWSHDIGGFSGRPTPDLYLRWAQFGFLSPLSRAHGTTTRLPWDYGEDALEVFREYAELRYRLLPYIYSYAVEASRTSIPILRPMYLEFPNDPATYALELQYMFGRELLVAPIFNAESRRSVYFPDGRWIDFWTKEVVEGPAFRVVEAPLEVLPLYVRAGALLPTVPVTHFLDEKPFENVTFESYVIDEGAFTLRDVDGETAVSARADGGRLEVFVEGPRKPLAFRFAPLGGPRHIEDVHVNGTRLELSEPGVARSGWSREDDGSVWVRLTD